MTSPLTLFHLGDVITGEPHLHCPRWLGDRRTLAQLEQDRPEFHLKTAVAMRLPRIILAAGGAAAVLLWLISGVTAQGQASTAAAGRFTPECAQRDLNVLTLIEGHREAARLPASMLAEAGLAQLDARLACLAGRQAEALAKYDRILNAPQQQINVVGGVR